MTSEVMMLNRDAVVLAADSAVTTGREPHPRYSKSANKIFDLTCHGNVGVTIYSAADLDYLPWEIALKQFRIAHKDDSQLPHLKDYVPALVSYLENNPSLFTTEILDKLLRQRIFAAVLFVLQSIAYKFADFVDIQKSPAERASAWDSGYTVLKSEYDSLPFYNNLDQSTHDEAVAVFPELLPLLTAYVTNVPAHAHAKPDQLAELAALCLVKNPTAFLKNYTGVVFAGYGKDEIFPSFQHIWIYGHIGTKLLWVSYNDYAITHDNDAWIQPFAQSSMIDRFTDGFDSTVRQIVMDASKSAFDSLINDLKASGVAIDDAIAASSVQTRHTEFNDAWQKANWEKNFHPLRRVLNSLSVPEMGHLAESLLVLEALRERVTSPSESVGGPIDVAVITKAEGLIWLKRKHFFNPDLNLKYLNRSKF